MFGDALDKSAAYIFYNVVSPIVCEGFPGNENATPKNLELFNYGDWGKWSIKDKAVYISGYIDTVVSSQMRLRDAGVKNDLVVGVIALLGSLLDLVCQRLRKSPGVKCEVKQ